ncbi:hypothetical protein MED01_002422 [Micromonospora sp. MED01]|uniref:hypothetical protein n=1 Tax=Micromonospora alfalfae TaxID=2911212 RepID=UPI001EE7DF69|nr:hypothetical protein [Micromonospora alfalfae]MCG5464257.1 hypothetical protein [Micromonospora alfalfae]
MSDTTTATPPATAATSTTRQRAAARPTVSLRPAAVGAVNIATIAGATVVAAGGGAVLAALAGGGALAATAAGARKKRQAAAQRTSTVRTVRSSSGPTGRGGGGLSRSGAGSPGGRAPGSKPSPTPRGAGGRPTGGANSSGLGGLLRKRSGGPGGGAGRGSGAGGGGGRSPAAGSGGHRRAGSKPGAASRAPLTADRVAAARRKLASRRQPGPRMSDAVRAATTPNGNGKPLTARQAFANARRGVTGDNPKRRGAVRRAAAGLLAGAIAWDKTQRAEWQRRKKAEAARKAKNDRIAAAKQGKPGVGTTVRRPADATDQTSNTRKPAPMPVRPELGPYLGTVVLPRDVTCAICGGQLPANEWAYRTRSRGFIGQCCGRHVTAEDLPVTSTTNLNKGSITMTHPLLAISEDFLAAALRNQPEGKLQVVAEAHMLPLAMENFVKAMKIRFDRAQEYAFHDSIKEMYGLVHKAQVSVLRAAEEIGPSIENIHKHELDRLRNPRVGEEMWDVARNRGQV